MNSKKEKQMHIMIMVIGALSIIFGIYAIIAGDAFKNQIHSIFLGASLFGVGILYYRKIVNKKE